MTVLAAYNRKNYVYIPLLAVATQFSKTGWLDKVVWAVGTAMHSQVKAALEFLEIFKRKWISSMNCISKPWRNLLGTMYRNCSLANPEIYMI